jgi:hypothetical protein
MNQNDTKNSSSYHRHKKIMKNRITPDTKVDLISSSMDALEEEVPASTSLRRITFEELRKKLHPLKIMSLYSGMASSIGSASSLNTFDGDYEMEPGDTNHNINVVVR